MSTLLQDGQFELDARVVFGRRTRYISGAPGISEPEITNQDTDKAGADGVRFGRDRRGSRTLTFDLTVDGHSPEEADTLSGVLEMSWLADAIRTTPGERSVLRYAKGGRTRRVYGRPRKIAPATGLYWQGRVDYTAEFITADHLFYDDELQQVATYIVPPASGGLSVPALVPFLLSDPATGQGQFTIGGGVATPVVTRIYGPFTDPSVEFIGEFTIAMVGTLASDDYVDIDPASGTVMTRFGKNWAGKFTHGSPALSGIRLSPGAHTVVLRAADQTGTASLALSWRDAYASF